MSFGAVVVNRFAKISGALVKGVSYPFHFLFKNKRFTIPKYSKPLIKSSSDSAIPKIIWQTNYTNKVTLPLYINYLFNRLLSLDFEYRYVSTEDREEYLKQNATKEQFEAFSKLTDGAAQADFWRLFVLNFEGGVYMDIDAHLVWPLSKIIKNKKEVFIRAKRGHINNYFLATSKDNDILKATLEMVVDNIENKRVEKGVYFLTGPTVLNSAIEKVGRKIEDRFYRITAIQGSFTNEYFQYLDKKDGKWNKKSSKELLK